MALETDANLLFGQLCIEEGIAYEIDRMTAGGGAGTPATDNAPPFPYIVLRKLARARSTVDIDRIDLVALGTLALLTTDPAVTFIEILDEFGLRRSAGEEANQALDVIWHGLRPHSEEVIKVIIDYDLPSIVADFRG